MLNLLLTDQNANANTGSSWWIYVVLIVLVVLMLVLPTITNRRRMKEYNQMVDRLRVGDEVRTIGGIIGRVTKITKTDNGATFVLETGAKGSKTTMEFDMNAVGTVLKSTYQEEPKVENKAESKNEEPKAAAETEVKENKEEKEEKVELEPQVEKKDNDQTIKDIEKQVSGKSTKPKAKKSK